MIRYDYKCRECQKDFYIVTDITDKRLNVKCNYCQSSNIFRVFNVVILKSENIKDIENKKTENLKEDHHHGGQCSPENDYI